MSRPVIIRQGSNSVLNFGDKNEKTLFFGDDYHMHFNNISYVTYDWIQNTSKAYINTGLIPNANCKYEFKLKFTSSSPTSWRPIGGALDNNPQSGIWFGQHRSSRYFCEIYWNGTSVVILNADTSRNNGDEMIYTIDIYTKTVSIRHIRNGSVLYDQSLTSTKTNIGEISGNLGNFPIYLTTYDQHGLVDIDRNGYTYPCRVYYFKVYDVPSNTLIHNLVPALYQETPGMMDTITNQFSGNANSTGTLTLGND